MCLKKIISALFLSLSLSYADNISLPSTDFNFVIKPISSQSAYKPLIAFVSDGKTYIKFPPTVTKNHLPVILVDALAGYADPVIRYQSGYVVINQPSTRVEIFNPKTHTLLYQLTLEHRFNYADIPPSPRILPYEFAGFFTGLTVGAANIDSKGYAPAAGAALGYDWSLSHRYGFMAGFELGANYDGKHTGDSATVRSWDLNLMVRAKYLFESGIDIVAKVGPAYVWNRDDSNADIDNALSARAGIGLGYLFTNGLGLNLEYNHLFSTAKVHAVNGIFGGISYIF